MKREKEVVIQEFYEDGAMKQSSQSKEREDDGSLEFLQVCCALALMILAYCTFSKLIDARKEILNHQGTASYVSGRK